MMMKYNFEAFFAVIPSGPYLMYKRHRISFKIMLIFYMFEITAAIGVMLGSAAWNSELLAMVLGCAGLVCLAFLPPANPLFFFRSGKPFQRSMRIIIIPSIALLFIIVFLLKYENIIYINNVPLLLYLYAFFIFVVSMIFLLFNSPD